MKKKNPGEPDSVMKVLGSKLMAVRESECGRVTSIHKRRRWRAYDRSAVYVQVALATFLSLPILNFKRRTVWTDEYSLAGTCTN